MTCQFDSLSRVTQRSDPRGVVHRFRYDGDIPGGPGTPPRPFTCMHECDVDNNNSLEVLSYAVYWGTEQLSCTNSNGFTTTCVRDSAGNLTQTNFPDGTHEVYGFDNYGRENSFTHKDGTIVAADLNRDGRPDLVTVSGPPGAVPVDPVDFRYDGLSRVVQCDQGDSHLVFTYDSLGNQLSEHHNGHGVTRTFNHRGRTGIACSGGTRFAETRNAIGLIAGVSAVSGTGASTPVSTVVYAGHRVASETRANGVVTTHTYRADGDPPLPGGTEDFSFDQCGRTVCTNGAGTVISNIRVRREAAQNVTQCNTFFTGVAQSIGRRHIQGYDRLSRLTQSIIQRREVAGGPFVLENLVTYALDLEGRRLSESDGIVAGFYTQNPLLPPGDHQMGQYSSWPGGPLQWDDQGCLTMMSSSAGQKQFVYDAASRLVAVNDPATSQHIATYAYSGDGRRTRSTIVSDDPLVPPVTTFFVYDGATCVQELDGDGLPNFTMAAAAGVHLCIISRNGSLVYPHGGGAAASMEREARPAVGRPILQGITSSACVFTGQNGAVLERRDCDDGCYPIFLTGDGRLRQGATDTLSGYRWMAPECIWCPESRFLQCDGGVYSPELGTGVSSHKEKPKAKPVVKCHELTGHVTLIK